MITDRNEPFPFVQIAVISTIFGCAIMGMAFSIITYLKRSRRYHKEIEMTSILDDSEDNNMEGAIEIATEDDSD
jgi:formiminotetrahydrofolate cyclodeaminase